MHCQHEVSISFVEEGKSYLYTLSQDLMVIYSMCVYLVVHDGRGEESTTYMLITSLFKILYRFLYVDGCFC